MLITLGRGARRGQKVAIFGLFADQCVQLIERVLVLGDHFINPNRVDDRRLDRLSKICFEMLLKTIVTEAPGQLLLGSPATATIIAALLKSELLLR